MLFFLPKGLFLSPAHHSGLLSVCVCVCLHTQVGNVLLCNEEAVLCLIFKDNFLPSLGVLNNVQLNFTNVLNPEKQTGESGGEAAENNHLLSLNRLWEQPKSICSASD